jgi:hypothetical protein
MKLFARWSCALLLIATGACTSHSAERRSSPTTTSAGPPVGTNVCAHEGGAVSGSLRMVGGPPGAGPDAVPGSVSATSLSDDGSLSDETCKVTVGTDGHFTMTLSPGKYRFTGRSPRYNQGQVDCGSLDSDVVVPPRSETSARLVVSVDCPRR